MGLEKELEKKCKRGADKGANGTEERYLGNRSGTQRPYSSFSNKIPCRLLK
jgi:hypothetical protein